MRRIILLYSFQALLLLLKSILQIILSTDRVEPIWTELLSIFLDSFGERRNREKISKDYHGFSNIFHC